MIWSIVSRTTEASHQRRLTRSLAYVLCHAVIYASVPGLAILSLSVLFSGQVTPATVIVLSSTALVVPVLRYLCLSRQTKLAYGVAFEIGVRLRRLLIEHLRHLPLGLIRTQQTGRLTGLFNDDVKWIEGFVGGGAGLTFGALALPVILLAGAFVLDPLVALVLVGGIVLGLPVIALYDRVMARSVKERVDRISDLSSRIGEHFEGLPVLRAFNAVGTNDRAFQRDLDALVQAYRRSAWTITPFSVLGLFLMESALAVAAYVGLSRTGVTPEEATTILFVLFAGLCIFNPILLFLAGSGQYRLAKTAADNLDGFLALDRMQTRTCGLAAPTETSVSFDKVSFSYGEGKTAVSNISFKAKSGELTAIVGPSGAGKTTLFNLLGRFWEPESGKICIDGRDIREISEGDLCRMLAIVTQETVLIRDTIRRNIDLGIEDYDDRKIAEAVRAARCEDFIAALPDGLESNAGEAGGRLSGGQKQRLTIARALLKDAPIILLDEALASVDASNARLIHQSLSALTAAKTVIVIAHQLSTIRRADKIIVIDGGSIVAEGGHQNLLDHCELYAALWHDHEASKSWKIQS